MKKMGVKTTLLSLKRLLGHIRTYRKRYMLGLVVHGFGQDFIFNILFSMSFILLFQAGENKSMEELVRGIFFLSLGFVLTVFIYITGALLFETAHARETGLMRQKLFSHVIRIPAQWFEKSHSGDAVSRLTNDMQALESAWGQPLLNIVASLISGIGSCIVIFLIDPRFAMVIIPVSFIMFFISSRFIAPVKKKSDEVQKGHASLTERIVDLTASLKVVRIFNITPWIVKRLDDAIDNIYKLGMQRAAWRIAQGATNNLTGIINFMGMIFIGSFFVLNGWFNFSTLIAMVQLGNGINYMFWSMGTQLTALQNSLAGADRALDLLEHPTEHKGGEESFSDRAPVVELKGVTFCYEEGKPVLSGIDLRIGKGETVALVGGSGGGKSTLLKLINGYYLPQEGTVRIFGMELSEETKELIRSQTAYVPQTNYLFSGTIRENILYGKPDATEDEIVKAAKIAHAHDFIGKMQNGYESLTGERGVSISGGQKQRITIARAMIKNPPLLLLDEATSSLDTRSEKLIQKSIERLIAGKTCIIVAHRLSTILHADRILVVENGRIVEEGTHESLLQQNNRYAYYYNLQYR
ncbi:MAG: ABC transporter ATP-binding protein [Clostridia bacterium]